MAQSPTRTFDAIVASIVAERIADITDANRFPNLAEASAYYASLPDERREQLEREWEGYPNG